VLPAAVVGGLLGALAAVGGGLAPFRPAHAAPVGPPQAHDSTPYASSAATRYQVTFVARSCRSYNEVTANQARGDADEAMARPGRDSPYQPGQSVDVPVEDDLGAGCTDLPDSRFTLGSGRERKGRLSTVTGATFTTPATKEWTPRLDPTGKDTGGLLAGGVTVWLTDQQVGLAPRRTRYGPAPRPVGGWPGDLHSQPSRRPAGDEHVDGGRDDRSGVGDPRRR
jgi:hypothetical protein